MDHRIAKMLDNAKLGAESGLLAALLNAVALTEGGVVIPLPEGASARMRHETSVKAAHYVTGFLERFKEQPTKLIVASKAVSDTRQTSRFYWKKAEFATGATTREFNKSAFKYVMILRCICQKHDLKEAEVLTGFAEAIHEYLGPFAVLDDTAELVEDFRLLAAKRYSRSKSKLHALLAYAQEANVMWDCRENRFEAVSDDPFVSLDELAAVRLHLCFRQVAAGTLAMVDKPVCQEAIDEAVEKNRTLRFAVIERVALVLTPHGDGGQFTLKASPITVLLGNPGDSNFVAWSQVGSYRFRSGTPFGYPLESDGYKLVQHGDVHFTCANYRQHYEDVFGNDEGPYAPQDLIDIERQIPLSDETLEFLFKRSNDSRWSYLSSGETLGDLAGGRSILPFGVTDQFGAPSDNLFDRLRHALLDGTVERAVDAELSSMVAAMEELKAAATSGRRQDVAAFRSRHLE